LALPLRAELIDAIEQPYPAPDLTTNGQWFNSQPFKETDTVGKVVLVDFWTYSCINCLRVMPYIKAWYERYKDQGLVVLSVHAPEFDFEKDPANVEKALSRFKITWPVVMDNDHTLWDRFKNQYWPAHYLINKEGHVVYQHFGEGKYDITENNIRELINAQGRMADPKDSVGVANVQQSMETYTGVKRGDRIAVVSTTPGMYQFPQKLENDYWALNGGWSREDEYSEATTRLAGLKMHFRGGKVFVVMGTADGSPVRARILLNDMPAGEFGGRDANDSFVTITDHRLYEVLDLKRNGNTTDSKDNYIEIQAERPGLRIYAFTFGA
jgi:thiol-disulfide isomerase/thioredoxin